MTSVSLSKISYSIRNNFHDLPNLVKGPDFNPTWIEKLQRNPKKAKSFVGNFAVTYHFQSKGHGGKSTDYGIRMWHSKVKDDDIKRYRILNSELLSLNKDSPKHIRFAPMKLYEPEENGFLVGEKRYPCLRMEWQDAENLDVFVNNIMRDSTLNYDQKKSLFREIKQKVLEVGEILYKKKCSHGDLSSGNIMVSQQRDNSIKIHVVDFDSFYSEKLSSLSPSSIGHPDWQHPGYISGALNLFGLKSDYCPLLTLIITLEALATDLGLYDQFSPPSQDGSGILIRKKDLSNPKTSPVFNSMLDLNNPILTTYIDDLIMVLSNDGSYELKRPKSVMINQQVARPTVSVTVKRHQSLPKAKSNVKSWQISKTIESESDLIEALDNGATQMAIVKAMKKQNFKRKFNQKSMLKFYEIVTQHFGGLENCEDDLQTEYVFALSNAGKQKEANDLAEKLYKENPSNPHIGYKVFSGLQRKKRWSELLEITTNALDLTPGNVNVNYFNSIALLNANNLSVDDAFADARVRTNDNWRILCDIIDLSKHKKYADEELYTEVFEVLMETISDPKLQKQIENLSKHSHRLFNSIIQFLRTAIFFKSNPYSKSVLTIKPAAIKLCKSLPGKWVENVEKMLHLLKKYQTDLDTDEFSENNKYSIIEVMSNLSIWGTGDSHPELSKIIQKWVYSLEWSTNDGLPIAASFDTSTHDSVIVWYNGSWRFYKDRSKVWNSRIGNIWV